MKRILMYAAFVLTSAALICTDYVNAKALASNKMSILINMNNLQRQQINNKGWTFYFLVLSKTDDSQETHVNNNLQFAPSQWRFVKQVFRLHIPQNSKALSQLIIDVPSTVAVSNDIDVLDEKGKKINITVSASGRRIIIDFPETVIPDTKLIIEFNKVKQPILNFDSVYNFWIKVVDSDTEIPVGIVQFAKP